MLGKFFKNNINKFDDDISLFNAKQTYVIIKVSVINK